MLEFFGIYERWEWGGLWIVCFIFSAVGGGESGHVARSLSLGFSAVSWNGMGASEGV